MSTQLDKDVSAVLSAVMPKAEARAKFKGRVLAAVERSEIARLIRESLRGNHEALETLQLYTGTPAFPPAKPAVPAVNEETNLGKALLSGHRGSPFFAETAPRSGAEIAEDASIPGVVPGVSDAIARLPLVDGDSTFHELTRAWAMSVPFGGRRLDS
jgi:hypothetical protein